MTTGWGETLDRLVTRTLQPGGIARRLVVVAAHPSDETLGAGGFLRAAHAAGVRVELVVATDGEAPPPEHTDVDGTALARRRRDETDAALSRLGLDGVPVHRLGLPDSALDADVLAGLLEPLLAGADACLAPWAHDPHPDHAAAGRAVAAAAPQDARRWQYPIGMWTGHRPDDPSIPWARAYRHDLSAPEKAAKVHAIAAYVSQTEPLVPGGRPVLDEATLDHVRSGPELFFRDPAATGAPVERFAALYRDHGDPWGVRQTWYERRKQAVLLACLPRDRYRHAAEPGCGLGELTRELARRCDHVDASDFTPEAVAAATTATRGLDGVRIARHALPDADALPDGIDLAVCSEVLYYLADDDLLATVERLASALVTGGDLVLACWRGWPADAPSDARAVHARVAADPRFDVLVDHVDEHFLLHVLRRS